MTVRLIRLTHAVRIEVRDRGPGVPTDYRVRIFEPFVQVDSSDSRPQSGTGLGLSITKVLVTAMRGLIGFEDAPEGGSVFYVELPWLEQVNGALVGGVAVVYLEEGTLEPAVPQALRLLGWLPRVATTAVELDTCLAELVPQVVVAVRAPPARLAWLQADTRLSEVPLLVLGTEVPPWLDPTALHAGTAIEFEHACRDVWARTKGFGMPVRCLIATAATQLSARFQALLPAAWFVKVVDRESTCRQLLGQACFDVVIVDANLAACFTLMEGSSTIEVWEWSTMQGLRRCGGPAGGQSGLISVALRELLESEVNHD